jgi:hypothetical protein
MVTGRSVTAILHFLNQTPMDWYSKKQATFDGKDYEEEQAIALSTTRESVKQIYEASKGKVSE